MRAGGRAEEPRLAPCRGFSCRLAKAIAALSEPGCSGYQPGGSRRKITPSNQVAGCSSRHGSAAQHSRLLPPRWLGPRERLFGSDLFYPARFIRLPGARATARGCFCGKNVTFLANSGTERDGFGKSAAMLRSKTGRCLRRGRRLFHRHFFPGKAEHFLD